MFCVFILFVYIYITVFQFCFLLYLPTFLLIFISTRRVACDCCVVQVASGPGLSFIAFSEALGHMPGGPFWSVLFFLMLITLALDSMFGSVEVPLTDILDELGPRFRFLTKMRVLLVLCVGEMILGLIFVIQSGYYTFQLFNTYTVSLPLLTIALFECLVVSWLYGIERLVG